MNFRWLFTLFVTLTPFYASVCTSAAVAEVWPPRYEAPRAGRCPTQFAAQFQGMNPVDRYYSVGMHAASLYPQMTRISGLYSLGDYLMNPYSLFADNNGPIVATQELLSIAQMNALVDRANSMHEAMGIRVRFAHVNQDLPGEDATQGFRWLPATEVQDVYRSNFATMVLMLGRILRLTGDFQPPTQQFGSIDEMTDALNDILLINYPAEKAAALNRLGQALTVEFTANLATNRSILFSRQTMRQLGRSSWQRYWQWAVIDAMESAMVRFFMTQNMDEQMARVYVWDNFLFSGEEGSTSIIERSQHEVAGHDYRWWLSLQPRQ